MLSDVELIGALQVHPEVGRHAEVLRERRVRHDGPLSGENLKPVRRHLDHVGRILGRTTDLLQLVGEDFSGVSVRAIVSRMLC